MKYGHFIVSIINFSSVRNNMHVCVVEQAYLYLTTESVFMLLFCIYFTFTKTIIITDYRFTSIELCELAFVWPGVLLH